MHAKLWLVIIAVLLMVCLACAGCGQTVDSDDVLGAPIPVGSTEPVVIAFPDAGGTEWKEVIPYLSNLLRNRGWNIQIKSRPMAGQSFEQFPDAMKTDMAAGIAADGYVMHASFADQLWEDGFLFDLLPVVQSAAPALYSAYRPFFEQCGGGLPISAARYVKGRPMAFFLRADLAKEQQINAFSDVLRMLRGHPDACIAADAGYSISMGLASVYDAWAGEQGYYPLSLYGIQGAFYAAMNDETCTPVPVERLPGFDEYYCEVIGFYLSHRIIDTWDEERISRPSIVGYLGQLNIEMDLGFLAARQTSGADYVAYPLAGCGVPVMPMGQPYVNVVLAVPASSGKAAPLAAFVQWAMLDSNGYDLVQYGEPDRDYRLVDGRLEYLEEGMPMPLMDTDGLMYARYEKGLGALFFCDALERPSIFSARNYESLQPGVAYAEPPIWRIERLRLSWYLCRDAFQDIALDLGELIGDREALLVGSIPGTSTDADGPMVEQCLKRLRGMEPQTAALAEAYQQQIKELEAQQEE